MTNAYEPIEQACLRCGMNAPMRFAGVCSSCTDELNQRFAQISRAPIEESHFEPALHVTPNAVALKDD